jgi:hypothetical protein
LNLLGKAVKILLRGEFTATLGSWFFVHDGEKEEGSTMEEVGAEAEAEAEG